MPVRLTGQNLSGWFSAFGGFLRNHRGILVVLLCAAALIFPNLGRDALWNDEGDNAFWGLSIMKSGLPLAWDGRNFSSEDTQALTDNLVMVTLPWFPLYATAASMSVFGETTWAARFPFALAGWATVLAVYLLVRRAAKDKKAALYSAGMLLFSVQFFLYARSCRYYAFVMLFVCLALWIFLRLDNLRKVPGFVLMILLLFYSLYLPALCVLAALAFLTLVYRPFHLYRKGFWISLLVIAPLTLPWLFWTARRFSSDLNLDFPFAEIPARAGQLLIETGVTAPVFGWIGLLFLVKKFHLQKYAPLLILCGTVLAAFSAAEMVIHEPGAMATVGLRHCPAIIPLAAVITGLLVLSAGFRRRRTGLILLLVFGATHLGGNLWPWAIAGAGNPSGSDPEKNKIMHMPDRWWQMVFRCELPGYLLELVKDNPGTTSEICNVLRRVAGSNDTVFVNYEWESVYFCTRMPQAGKLDAAHPSCKIARKHGIPDYVFDASAATWVVWRPGWGFYQNGNSRILRAQADWESAGKTLVPVAEIRDTLWENRENLYYHRFPVLGHIYSRPWPVLFPNAVIFRVEQNGSAASVHERESL